MGRRASLLVFMALVMSFPVACGESRQSAQLAPTQTPTLSSSPSFTMTPTQTPMLPPTPTATPVPTKTFTPAPTPTPTITLTPTSTPITEARQGDWIITGSESVRDVRIILNGNLIIEPSGSLTMTNVTLLVQQNPPDMYRILAKPGSRLAIHSSTLAASQSDSRFGFTVQGAQFELKQSKLEGFEGGLQIDQANGAIIDGNTITHMVDGLRLTGCNNALITNNTIASVEPGGISAAIVLNNSHNAEITHNHILRQQVAVSVESSWNNYIAYNEVTLTDNTGGITIGAGSGNNTVAYNHISAHEGYGHA